MEKTLQQKIDEIDMASAAVTFLLERFQTYAEHAGNPLIEAVWQVAIIDAEFMKGNLERIANDLEDQRETRK